MKDAITALLKSRKFWLTVIAIIQAIALDYFEVDPEVWQSVATILMILVGTIAVEDSAQKIGGTTVNNSTATPPTPTPPPQKSMELEVPIEFTVSSTGTSWTTPTRQDTK